MKTLTTLVCNSCGANQTVTIKKPNHVLHLILTVLTGGLWLFVWVFAIIESLAAPSLRCRTCGKKITSI